MVALTFDAGIGTLELSLQRVLVMRAKDLLNLAAQADPSTAWISICNDVVLLDRLFRSITLGQHGVSVSDDGLLSFALCDPPVIQLVLCCFLRQVCLVQRALADPSRLGPLARVVIEIIALSYCVS